MGPFGSGKSSGCVIELVRWAQRQLLVNGKRRSRFAVIRNTYGQLADTTIKTFLQWLPAPVFGEYSKSEHVYILRLADVEAEFLFRALDRPEHVANLLSLELTGAWVNEACEIPWAVIKALKGRVDRFPSRAEGGCVDPGLILDTNPPDDDSWWYRLFEEGASGGEPGGVAIFKQPGGRSPEAEDLPNLSPTYYANLAAGSDPDFVVYVDGQYGFVKDGVPRLLRHLALRSLRGRAGREGPPWLGLRVDSGLHLHAGATRSTFHGAGRAVRRGYWHKLVCRCGADALPAALPELRR
jgi:hypothetical protein